MFNIADNLKFIEYAHLEFGYFRDIEFYPGQLKLLLDFRHVTKKESSRRDGSTSTGISSKEKTLLDVTNCSTCCHSWQNKRLKR